MTESRVEAVARAIAQAAAKREFGPRYEGYESSHREMGEAFAQAAIEANDAWFQGLGAFKAIYTCTSCGDEFEMTMATVQPCIQCKDGSRLLSIQEIKR